MSKTHKIYALINPIDNKPFYIGRTGQELKVRLYGHLCTKPTSKHGKKILQIIESGNKPTIQLIQECSKQDAYKKEIYWIKEYKSKGYELTNTVVNVSDDIGSFYSISASVNIDCKRIVKNTKARLHLSGMPCSTNDAITHIFKEYEKTLINKSYDNR